MAASYTDMAEGSGQSRFTHRVIIVAAIATVFLLAWYWRHVLLLAFGSILIAIGLDAIAKPIARATPLNRAAALVAAGLVVVGALVGIGWLFGSQVGRQIGELSTRLPETWQTQVRPWIAQLPSGPDILLQLEGWIGGAGEGGGLLSGAMTRVGGYTLSIASGVVDLLVVVIAAAFIAAGPGPYRKGALMLTPGSVRPRMERAMDATATGMRGWLLGILVSMTVMTTAVSLALWLLGVPAAIALGMIAGIGQIVPLIGPIIAAIPGVILALAIGPETALWTALVYLVASQLESNLLYPMILQKTVAMPAALNLFAIIAMGTLFGGLGVLLAAPLAIVISIFVIEFYVRGTLGEDIPNSAAAGSSG